jgi:Rrf2 family protein
MAREPTKQRSVDQLAEVLGVGPHHLAKVMQGLARRRWISGTRGAGGGYQLQSNPKEISMADVIELFEGPTHLTQCSLADANSPCQKMAPCQVGRIMQEINEQAYYTLTSVNLLLLAHPPERATGST